MDPIPDHCIQSPFGRNGVAAIHNDDRFNKYRALIVPWYRELYDKHMYTMRGFTCDVCGAKMRSSKSGAILGHLASKKHLRAAGVKLEEDESKRKRIIKKTVNAYVSKVNRIVGNVTSGTED